VPETTAPTWFVTPPADQLGRTVRRAYIAAVGGTMRPWDELPEHTREAFRTIGLAVSREVQKANQG
jgi:hypothetical protein